MNWNKIKEKKRKILRVFFGLFSFSAVMFVFQACYGIEQDGMYDVFFEGVVLSKSHITPIQGIKVSILGTDNYTITDTNGCYSFYGESATHYTLRFEDTDTRTNGNYRTLDTTLNTSAEIDNIKLHIALEEVN